MSRRFSGLGLVRRDARDCLGPSGPTYLLDYNNATVTRASEAAFQDPRNGWAFQAATEAANWKAVNTARIFGDGSILVEGSRTNIISAAPEGSHIQWVATATESADVGGDPDGGSDADRWTLSGSTAPGNGGLIRQNATVGVSAVAHTQTVWGRENTSTDGKFVLRSFVSAASAADQTITSSFARLEHKFTPAAGTLFAGMGNYGWGGGAPYPAAKDVDLWGHQVEAAAFCSSNIRTPSGTRPTEKVDFTIGADIDEWVRTKRWYISVWPTFSSTDTAATHPRVLAADNGAGNVVDLYRSGASGVHWILAAHAGSAVNLSVGPAWSAHDELQFEVLCNSGGNWELRMRNVTTASGWTVGTPVASRTCGSLVGGTLRIGNYPQATLIWPAFMVIGRPILGEAPDA